MEHERMPICQEGATAPLDGPAAAPDGPGKASASSDEPVPLRPVMDRTADEEQAARLRLITGRRGQRRRHLPKPNF